ncbi:MAG: sulfatase [Bacteroidota bacterium]
MNTSFYHPIYNRAWQISALLLLTACVLLQAQQSKLPNIIIVYADDLGYGDLSCFGAKDIATPNIDRLAQEGIQFTDFYSASSICSPSRAALMTGRIPQRMGIHAVFFPESFTGMPTDEITIADLLKRRGYATAHVGKWHLGHHYQYLPLQRGFDEYYGIPYSNDMESVVYMKNNVVDSFHIDQHYTTKTYTDEATDFIARNKEQPFFLYLAHSMPHVPIYASPKFEGRSERGLYGDVIQEIDWSMGEILKQLAAENLLDNTLIIFSSDNGPWLVMEDHGGSAGHLREGKQFTFDGGMRVPTLAMWKAKIPAGQVYSDLAVMMDWFPTIAGIVGAEIPSDRAYDGEDIRPVLFGTTKRKNDQFLFFHTDGAYTLRGFRWGDWKVKLPYAGFKGTRGRKRVAPHDMLLFNLKEDPTESINLAQQYPDKLAAMLAEMEKARTRLGIFPPPLVIRTGSDKSHYDYLSAKRKRKNAPPK